MKPLKNQWGSVKPYTRHSSTCKVEDDSCACPKWLYVRRRGEQDVRYALNTPSWAEALEKATDKLTALNPEIAESREAKVKTKLSRKTIHEAINLWIDRTRTLCGNDAQIVKQYRSTFGWVDSDGVKRGALLRYATDRQLEYVDELTPLLCQQWLNSSKFPGKAAYSKHQRWGTVRSFFNYLTELDVLESNPVKTIKAPDPGDTFAHAPYTDAQYKLILDQADWYVDERVRNGERDVYCKRMHNFLELLRWTGMDIIDAVQFHPELIEDSKLDGSKVSVLRYTRQKTGVEAIVPLAANLAKLLRATPSIPKSVAGMPFRYSGNDITSDSHNWSRRIANLIKLADITSIPLMRRDGRPARDKSGNQLTTTPDAKMLRHTFAVGELVKGVPEEVVAKMLGHSSTEMIRKHYAPWCKRRDEAHIRAVVASRK
jgi:site-specific recombinase XerD